MPAIRTVSAFEVAEHGELDFGVRDKAMIRESLHFERREEALCPRVIAEFIDGRKPKSTQRYPKVNTGYCDR